MRLTLFLALGLALVFSACDGSSQEERSLPADSTAIADSRVGEGTAAQSVFVADLEYSRLPTGRQVVSGRLINQTDRSLRNAQVQIALYDEYNRAIDRVLVVVQNVGAHGDQRFQETIENEQAVGARVRGIMTL